MPDLCRRPQGRLWAARILVGLVLGVNVQCAVAFLWAPQYYVASFEAQGASGEALVRSLGVLFLMWNVPYAAATWHPVRRRASLYEAMVMQAIGLVGESLLLWALPAGHQALRATAARFILFDGAGLVLLLAAAWLTKTQPSPVMALGGHRGPHPTIIQGGKRPERH